MLLYAKNINYLYFASKERNSFYMKVRRLIFLLLIILNCIAIFNFSNQVADDSSNTSRKSSKIYI